MTKKEKKQLQKFLYLYQLRHKEEKEERVILCEMCSKIDNCYREKKAHTCKLYERKEDDINELES